MGHDLPVKRGARTAVEPQELAGEPRCTNPKEVPIAEAPHRSRPFFDARNAAKVLRDCRYGRRDTHESAFAAALAKGHSKAPCPVSMFIADGPTEGESTEDYRA